MQRREFLGSLAATLITPAAFASAQTPGEKFAAAAHSQLGITRDYDPNYTRLAYPNGDVDRKTGVCADVIVRAGRDALQLDLQQLVHDDMLRSFAAYPTQRWGQKHPDANIDHRRVPNLEVFWTRAGAKLWMAQKPTAGDAFPGPLQTGDILTWLLDARLPHVGIVTGRGLWGTQIVHNIGHGVEESYLSGMSGQRANGHFRWPVA